MSDLTPDQRPEGWSEGASGYEGSFAVFTGSFADEALDHAGVAAGDRLLDVAAGSGALSLRAARRGAVVLATDFAPGMVDLLAKRLAEEGHDASRSALMDAQALDVEDGAFDSAFSMFGVMFCPDIPAAVSEMARAVRSGGKVCMATWRIEGFRVAGLVGAAFGRVIPGFDPPARQPPWARVGDADSLRATFEAAGLRDVEVHVATRTFDPPDPERFFLGIPDWSPPVKPMFEGLDDDTIARAAAAFAEVVEEARSSGMLDADALIAVGRKP